MKWLEKLRTYRILKKYGLSDHLWLETTAKLPLIASLDAVEMAKLRVLSTLLIHRKTFTGVQGVDVTPEMEIIIAAQACVEILKLGIDSFNGWEEIIIYPSAFKVEREVQDELGLVSNEKNILSGEAWGQGPVILSWDDVERHSFTLHPGHNVVIHEFAHKLDMLNGRANGMPPLHPDMLVEEWTESLSTAYQHLIKRIEHHHNEIDSYAATNPAEFFAVMCEYFFTIPHILKEYYPKVFNELRDYFRREHIVNRT